MEASSVTFKYKLHNRVAGIRVVGSCAELGSWNPLKGLPLLFRSAGLWSTDSVRIPGHFVEYKYFFLIDGHEGEWEPVPDNRKLNLQQNQMSVEDEHNSPISKVQIIPMRSCPILPSKFPDPQPGPTKIILASQGLPFELAESEGVFYLKRSRGIWMNLLYDVLVTNSISFLWVGCLGRGIPSE